MFREIVVDAHVICIETRGLLELACKDGGLTGRVARIGTRGRWYQREIRNHCRLDCHATGQKRAIARRKTGNDLHVSDTQALTKAFIRAKDEKLIFLDGATERKAELIALEWRLLLPISILEKVCGVQGAVAQIFESRAVKIIAAGSSSDVEDAPGGATVLGAVSIRQNCEFLN